MEIKTVGIVSLGCDKNRVDSEKLLGSLGEGFKITNDIEDTQILIINTCAFLAVARKEAIETVFSYLPYKEKKLEKIIMAGCLPEKFIDEIYDELYEVDGFLGTYDASKLKNVITDIYTGLRVSYVGKGEPVKLPRHLSTQPHFAYLKIADGCSNHCTYCLIPKIRGPYKSEPIEDLLAEAKTLGDEIELILVAQDTTRYGYDLYGENKLTYLIRQLSKLENIKSIRLLYCYPELVDDALINEFVTNPKLVKYVDIPMQHASDRILKLMGRKGSFKSNLELVRTLKKRVKGIAIRSTFIAGFPGETEEDVEILEKFLKRAKLFNAGFFAYSLEKDTPAYKLPSRLTAKVKRERVKRLYAVQNAVMGEILDKFIGKKLNVVCDGADKNLTQFYGRAYFSAPEIDGKVILKGDVVLNEGKTYKVKITKRCGCDLVGEVLYELT